MANGDKIKLGTMYVNGTKRRLPTRPYESSGNILSYTSGQTLEIKNSDSDDSFKIQWVQVDINGKKLLISDRCLLVNISYDELNSMSLISGKKVNIDGQDFILRVLTGGNDSRNGAYSGGTPENNEWDKIIANEGKFSYLPTPSSQDLDNLVSTADRTGAHNTFWNWYGMRSFCQEVNVELGSRVTSRGNESAKYFNHLTKNNKFTHTGWRPVLEEVILNKAPIIEGIPENLGTLNSPLVQKYTVTDNDKGDTFTLVEKLDNLPIRTLEKQTSGSFTIDLTNKWNEFLPDSNHMIKIEATDSKGETSSIMSTFKTPKFILPRLEQTAPLLETITYNSLLKQELLTNLNNFATKLVGFGIEVSDNEKTLPKLIEKLDLLGSDNSSTSVPEWYKNRWIGGTVIPNKLNSHGAALIDNIIYTIGGNTTGTTMDSAVNLNNAYDTTANSWSAKTVLPATKQSLMVESVNNILYSIGGENKTTSYTYTTHAYSPLTNNWTNKARIPGISASKSGSAVSGGKIYIIGGKMTNYNEVGNYEYDPLTDSWTNKALLPIGTFNLSAVGVGSMIYAMGGQSSTNSDTGQLNQVYDTTTNAWGQRMLMPKSRTSLNIDAIGDKIYLPNGLGSLPGERLNMHCYDTVNNTYETKKIPIKECQRASVVACKGNLYLMGGVEVNASGGILDNNQIYIP